MEVSATPPGAPLLCTCTKTPSSLAERCLYTKIDDIDMRMQQCSLAVTSGPWLAAQGPLSARLVQLQNLSATMKVFLCRHMQ